MDYTAGFREGLIAAAQMLRDEVKRVEGLTHALRNPATLERINLVISQLTCQARAIEARVDKMN